MYIILNMFTVIMILTIFLKIPKDVSFEKTSGRLNRISNDISGSHYARRSDFDDVKISMAWKTCL